MTSSGTSEGEEECYLELCSSPIRFEPFSHITNVFFDNANKQIFAVRSGGAIGVVVKGPQEQNNVSFRLEDKGPVLSIKFSPDQQILAVQRCKVSVEFVNFYGGNNIDTVEYSQACKGKNTIILGFVWTAVNEIVYITDHGLEMYQFVAEKKILKATKSYAANVKWFVFCPENMILVLATGNSGSVLQPYQLKLNNIYKLTKFEVDLPVVPQDPNKAKVLLQERDVTLAILYGQLCALVLRHQPKTVAGSGAEIVMYNLQKEGTDRRSHILKLDTSGRFAINVVDNLVLVHHQGSKTSMVFDISLPGESDGYLTYHHPITVALPIKPFKLKLTAVPLQGGSDPVEVSCELYSSNWVVFQPNIVIDAKMGCLWTLELHLAPFAIFIPDKCRLVDFLLQRRLGKPVVLSVLKSMLEPSGQGNQHNLIVIAKVFDRLNEVYRSFLEVEMQSQMAMPASMAAVSPKPSITPKAHVIIDQSDMYTNIFSQFVTSKEVGNSFILAVLIEYIRSLNQFQVPVQHYFYELVINALVNQKSFYQLHQFLQYHVVGDSKPLACLLLSLEGIYPAAHQLALDMLKRLSTANEEIIEVLLSKQQILPALRFVKSIGLEDNVVARKFLEASKNVDDPVVFYSVYNFFEQRNLKLRGSAVFSKGERCELYTEHFKSLFGKDSSLDISANSCT